ncbi:MAG: GUN4 domain-containing protein, partial [Coleofasciculaceae cyanobacterium]
RVLQHPEMGGFDEVEILTNPNAQDLRIAIYDLFAERHSEDVVLFYFSGHGVKDEHRNLYLTTPETRKSSRGVVVTPTAVAASYLQTQMNRSLCQREVIILDCCYSGAIEKGLTAKDEGEVDIFAELGGTGRAILTSSTSVQSSFQQDKGLSIYTQYIVEGIETGAADLDSDGRISADELHRYATYKVQEASPAMNPQFYPVEEGYRIYLARSPQDDPKLKYRKAVEEVVSEYGEDIDFIKGEIDLVNRCYLDELQTQLGLSSEDAAVIEAEVMEPYLQRFEKLQRYEEVLKQVWQKKNSLSDKDRHKLRRFQEVLGLRDEDVSAIEAPISPQAKPTPPPPKPDEVELRSEKGVDYTKLRDLLAAGKWKEADEETAEVMIKAAGQEERGYLEREDIEKFPCADLRTIDQLWVKYSNGRFGFSVQKRIWLEVGGKVDYETEKKLGDRLGWRGGGEWCLSEWLK